MDLMEYMARELFVKYDIPTMNGVVIDSMEDLETRAAGLKFPVVAKAQVQTGGRGKAGGIVFAGSMDELMKAGENIMGMSIKGHTVKKLLIVEKLQVKQEWYLSIMLDRLTKGPVVIFSLVGGMDIEDTAKASPGKVIKVNIDPLIGVHDYLPRYLLSKSGCNTEYFKQLLELLKKLYRMFCECDCILAEINPLSISAEDRLVALDGKITVDDSALYRQPDVLAFRDSLTEEDLVLEAREFGFLYINCEAGGSIGVMSNGSGMIMSCIDLISRQGMRVGAALDLGGGATSDRIREAIRIILSNERIKGLLISIFGGITRCDEVAAGIKLALEKLTEEKLVIVRFEGTNKETGLEILQTIRGSVIAVNDLEEGVKELGARREQL